MPHILFIHPDQKLVDIYHRHLSPHFTIDSAHDGLAGLRKIREGKPKVIVSEHDLPMMSGMAILKYVRNHPDHHMTPFIFLTNSLMPDDALGLGASAWLRQSELSPEQLLPHIYHHYQLTRNY
jgi:two-component system, chemotaxis family, chemotaxis protein CheY